MSVQRKPSLLYTQGMYTYTVSTTRRLLTVDMHLKCCISMLEILAVF